MEEKTYDPNKKYPPGSIKQIKLPDGRYKCPVCGFVHTHSGVVASHIYAKHIDKSQIKRKSKTSPQTTLPRFQFMQKAEAVRPIEPVTPAKVDIPEESDDYSYLIPTDVVYDDWSNAIPILEIAYRSRLNVLIIGPKGTGKTTLVRYFAQLKKKPLFSVNFSLRTRETHLVGSVQLVNGNTEFTMGILPVSMKIGAWLYLDELNAAEPDTLLRLDEALDDRREIVLKESGKPIRVKAHSDWWVIATINPLTHAGTKELPPQLLSRFPVRIYLDYPPLNVEKRIIKKYVPDINGEDLEKGIKLANKLREAAKVEDLPYSPSIRETIAYARLLRNGVEPRKAAEIVFLNAYVQWGEVEAQKVRDLIDSIYGTPKTTTGGAP